MSTHCHDKNGNAIFCTKFGTKDDIAIIVMSMIKMNLIRMFEFWDYDKMALSASRATMLLLFFVTL